MRTLGVDISHWEGKIDWRLAAVSIGFAFYKCTDGIRYIDQQFYENRRGCNEVGLAHAPYHFYQPALDPLVQAEDFIRTAGKSYGRYIVDVEVPDRQENITQKLLAFLQRVEQLTGKKPAIYTSPGYWNEFIQPHPRWAGGYELLVAHYTLAHDPTLPVGWTTWRIWQFSKDWFFPGCQEQADADWFNGSLLECRAWFGNASDPQPPPSPQPGLHLVSLFDNLHIRQSPGMQSRVIGDLKRGEQVQVEGLGGEDVWIRHPRGWTCVEKDGYRYMVVVI